LADFQISGTDPSWIEELKIIIIIIIQSFIMRRLRKL